MVQQHNILKITLSLLLMLMGMLPAAAQNVVLQESFDNLDGDGGNNGRWNLLDRKEIEDGEMPTGWSISPQNDSKSTVCKGNKCVYIGVNITEESATASGNAYLETPAIATPGTYMLHFKAGALQTSNEREVMQVIESAPGTIDIEQSQFKITKGTFSDFSTKIIVKKGNASIRFGNVYRKNNRFLLDEIKIVQVGNTSTIDPEFSFSQSTCTVSWTGGDATITSPTLNTNVDADKITYSSSQENVATVDTKGVVTVHNEGTTTITATFGGDDNFNSATASYTLNVVKGNYTYKRATTFEAGKAYLIVSEDSEGNWYIANPTTNNKDGLPLEGATQTTLGTIVNETDAFESYLIHFVVSNKNYLMQSLKTSNYISINISSYKFAYTVRTASWVIEDNPFGEDGRFIIKTTNDRFLRMTEGNNTNDFRTYSSESLGRPIFLYEKVTTPPSGTIKISAKEGYGTFYSDKSIIMPEGLCGATVTDVEENGKLKYNWKYNAGDVVPAHTGLLLYASQPGSFDYYEATESTNAMQKASGLDQTNDVVGGDGTQGGTPDETQEVNYLHGTTADETIAEDETLYKFYQLSYGTINGTRTIGFFFENAQGGVFLNKANKAYLSIPRNISAQSAFSLERNNPIMSITEQLQQTQGAQQIFDISGNRIPTTGHLQKGIYIVNGQKLIIR